MHDLSAVELAYAQGNKGALEELRLAAEKFKTLEANPVYQEFVLQLRKTCHNLTEEIVDGVGADDAATLVGKAKYRDAFKFMLNALREPLQIWDESVRYLDELEKEEKQKDGTNLMMPESSAL